MVTDRPSNVTFAPTSKLSPLSFSCCTYLTPPSSSCFVSSFSSFSSAVRRSSASTTISTAEIVFDAATSCSTSRMSICGGIPAMISSFVCLPIAVIKVDLPQPFGPIRPYRRPWASDKGQSLKRVLPPIEMENLCTCTSSLPSILWLEVGRDSATRSTSFAPAISRRRELRLAALPPSKPRSSPRFRLFGAQ